jgi:hypothetical protein
MKMPLIHKKTPAAFKQNIKTEIKAGKPQKQAVAIAYSEKRRAEQHKAHGGKIEDCPHCMDDGGQVEKHWYDFSDEAQAQPAPKPTGSNSNSDSSAAKLGQGWKAAGFAEGGEVEDHEKGIHKDDEHSGRSMAGIFARHIKDPGEVGKASKHLATKEHEKVIGELRSMPKPKLQGLAKGGEVEEAKELDHDGDHDADQEIHHALGKELMSAFESKDHKKIMDTIEACVLSCRNKIGE